MTDLFGNEEPPEIPDWYSMTAIRVGGMPEGWTWRVLDGYKKPPGYTEVKGAAPIGKYTRGPRKGEPKWPKAEVYDILWIKDSEFDETKRLWEEETGKCSTCYGTGQEHVGWSKAEGSKHKPCEKCNATGKATQR